MDQLGALAVLDLLDGTNYIKRPGIPSDDMPCRMGHPMAPLASHIILRIPTRPALNRLKVKQLNIIACKICFQLC